MKQPSGKFVIRMPGTLHALLKQEAASSGKSLNHVCIAKLQTNGSAISSQSPKSALKNSILPGFLERVVQQWRSKLIGLILFGSAARGEATSESDIDLLLVMKPEIKIERNLYRLWEEFCGEHFSPHDYGTISPHFAGLPGSVFEAGGLWYETAIEGIILWERKRLISRFLASVRKAMAHGKIRRRVLHGSPYWIKG